MPFCDAICSVPAVIGLGIQFTASATSNVTECIGVITTTYAATANYQSSLLTFMNARAMDYNTTYQSIDRVGLGISGTVKKTQEILVFNQNALTNKLVEYTKNYVETNNAYVSIEQFDQVSIPDINYYEYNREIAPMDMELAKKYLQIYLSRDYKEKAFSFINMIKGVDALKSGLLSHWSLLEDSQTISEDAFKEILQQIGLLYTAHNSHQEMAIINALSTLFKGRIAEPEKMTTMSILHKLTAAQNDTHASIEKLSSMNDVGLIRTNNIYLQQNITYMNRLRALKEANLFIKSSKL